MARLIIHFERFGPYHHARLKSAQKELSDWEVQGLEIAGSDETYAWDDESSSDVIRVFEEGSYQDYSGMRISREVTRKLDELKPEAIAIAGYASPDARACLAWAEKNNARAILMSETRECDAPRNWVKEFFKSRLLRSVDGALVGGESHLLYLAKLGLKNIQIGYNVVDNENFKGALPKTIPPVLLASNRFIPRKNLKALLEAFMSAEISTKWSLCLLGDGDERESLEEISGDFQTCAPWDSADKKPGIFLPGFQQYADLSKFYATASAFIHPALSEPWGLVINEAMASGLPILSSKNVGAAEELVDHRENGWKFDPTNFQEIRIYLDTLYRADAEQLKSMGEASRRILEERCPTSLFGSGLKKALS